MAKSILVGKKPTNYEVKISKSPISKKDILSAIKTHNKVLIITDNGVPTKYIQNIKKLLRGSIKTYFLTLPSGEKSKSFKSLKLIFRKFSVFEI